MVQLSNIKKVYFIKYHLVAIIVLLSDRSIMALAMEDNLEIVPGTTCFTCLGTPSFRSEVFARDKDLQARGFSNVQLVCDKQPGNSDLLIDLLNIHKYCYSNLNRLISQVVYTLFVNG